MRMPRVIPCLLLKGKGLVKTVKFKNAKYVGDPINAVRIFNDKEVDELAFLDITATVDGGSPKMDVIADIASQCFMPISYGGGVTTIAQMRDILNLGVEKVIVNTAAVRSPEVIREAAALFGSQSIVVSIDAKKKLLGGYEVYTHGGTKSTDIDVLKHAVQVEKLGAGEILLTSIDHDGTMSGYDIDLVKSVSKAVRIPVIASGGAGKVDHFGEVVKLGGASAVAAGSLFVFHGVHRAVLINYPDMNALKRTFNVMTH